MESSSSTATSTGLRSACRGDPRASSAAGASRTGPATTPSTSRPAAVRPAVNMLDPLMRSLRTGRPGRPARGVGGRPLQALVRAIALDPGGSSGISYRLRCGVRPGRRGDGQDMRLLLGGRTAAGADALQRRGRPRAAAGTWRTGTSSGRPAPTSSRTWSPSTGAPQAGAAGHHPGRAFSPNLQFPQPPTTPPGSWSSRCPTRAARTSSCCAMSRISARALRTLGRQERPPVADWQAIAVLGAKGGVGTTSVAVNLADALAQQAGPRHPR